VLYMPPRMFLSSQFKRSFLRKKVLSPYSYDVSFYFILFACALQVQAFHMACTRTNEKRVREEQFITRFCMYAQCMDFFLFFMWRTCENKRKEKKEIIYKCPSARITHSHTWESLSIVTFMLHSQSCSRKKPSKHDFLRQWLCQLHIILWSLLCIFLILLWTSNLASKMCHKAWLPISIPLKRKFYCSLLRNCSSEKNHFELIISHL
jgi:hypothetical protein